MSLKHLGLSNEQYQRLLTMTVRFYHELLYKNRPQYQSQWDFLHTWDMEQPDLKKFKVGYCPVTNAFAEHYQEILKTYPLVKDALKAMGVIKEVEDRIEDGLKDHYFFPCYDEKGNVFNIILYHPQKGFRPLFEDKPRIFGLWQEGYCFEQCGSVFILPDIKVFFQFNRLLYPTGFNPCLACFQEVPSFLVEKIEDLGADQMILIGTHLAPDADTFLDVLKIEYQGEPLKALKQALPQMSNQKYRRLIEAGFEVLRKYQEQKDASAGL